MNSGQAQAGTERYCGGLFHAKDVGKDDGPSQAFLRDDRGSYQGGFCRRAGWILPHLSGPARLAPPLQRAWNLPPPNPVKELGAHRRGIPQDLNSAVAGGQWQRPPGTAAGKKVTSL